MLGIQDPLTFLPLRRRQRSKAAFPVNAPPIVDQLHSLSVVADDPNHKPSSARLLALLQRSELHDLALDQLRQGLCVFDGQKLCPDEVPDETKVTVCMMAKEASLSSACREVFDRGRACKSEQRVRDQTETLSTLHRDQADVPRSTGTNRGA